MSKGGDDALQPEASSTSNSEAGQPYYQVQSPGSCEPTPTPGVADEENSESEMLRIQDELVVSKLREAEANLSLKEFEQKLSKLERQWRQFLEENRSGKVTPQTDLKDTVMALRLRETCLVCDVNNLKEKLMELETKNHIYQRQAKRQEAEHAALQESLAAAESREKELLNTITLLERKVSNMESKCKEDAMMSKIREAEYSQSLEDSRRRIAELEIENQELVTSAKLQSRDVRDLETRISEPDDEEVLQVKMQHSLLAAMATADDRNIASGRDFDPMTSSLLLTDSIGLCSESLTQDCTDFKNSLTARSTECDQPVETTALPSGLEQQTV